MINKRALVNLYKDVVLVTCVRIFQQQHKNRDQKSYPSVPSFPILLPKSFKDKFCFFQWHYFFLIINTSSLTVLDKGISFKGIFQM